LTTALTSPTQPATVGRPRTSGPCGRRKCSFDAAPSKAAYADRDIEYRLTTPRDPWTNGHVERMNRTIKDATVKRFHAANHDQFRQHRADFVAAYNFGRRLKMLKGLTPYEFICQCWTKEPGTFTLNPLH
jgi:transposase InsO family protein